MKKETPNPKIMIPIDLDFHKKVAQIRLLVQIREKCAKSNRVLILAIAYWCKVHIQRIDAWHFGPMLDEACKKENRNKPITIEELHPNFSILMAILKTEEKTKQHSTRKENLFQILQIVFHYRLK